jgi:hypothetical protein
MSVTKILLCGRPVDDWNLFTPSFHCQWRSDWIILPKLTNQNNSIISTLKWIVNKRYFLYSTRNGFSTCTHVGFFQYICAWVLFYVKHVLQYVLNLQLWWFYKMFQKKWWKKFGNVYLYKHVGQLSWKNGEEDLGMFICSQCLKGWPEFFFLGQ